MIRVDGTFRIACMAALLGAGLALAGCEEEGPAERAGKSLDNAAEQAGESIERAGENIQEKAD